MPMLHKVVHTRASHWTSQRRKNSMERSPYQCRFAQRRLDWLNPMVQVQPPIARRAFCYQLTGIIASSVWHKFRSTQSPCPRDSSRAMKLQHAPSPSSRAIRRMFPVGPANCETKPFNLGKAQALLR